jgi:hypothetical protein
MTEALILRRGGDYERNLKKIDKKIESMVKGCYTSDCWLLKDESKNGGRIYLKRKTVGGSQGRYVYIRRFLFLSVFGELPDCRNIYMLCENDRLCVNPTHMTYRGFKRTYEMVEEFKKRGWITDERAEELYLK